MRIIPVLAVCLSIFSNSCNAQPHTTTVGVMFYNLENLYDTINDPAKNDEVFLPGADRKWDNQKYHEKLQNISQVIATVGNMPVLVGLCEAENESVLNDLIAEKKIKDGNYKYIHFDSPDERGIDVALLYNEKLFVPKKYFSVPVHLNVEEEDYTRDILYVHGEIDVLGKKEAIHVFVNHWPSRAEGEEISAPKRAAAAQTLKHQVDSLLTSLNHPNIIIMGDFNDTPYDKSILQILDAKEKLSSAEETLVNLAAEKQKIGEGSYNYKGNWQALDQIIVSSSLLDKTNLDADVSSFRFLQEDFMMYMNNQYGKSPSRSYSGTKYYGGYSDHLPVYVGLQFF